MKYIKLIIVLFLISNNLLLKAQSKAFSLQFEGQLIGWANGNFNDHFSHQWGIRYIPELFAEYKLNEIWTLDAAASVNSYGAITFYNDGRNDNGDLKPYRLWARLSSKQFELRAGLQKINFGSASILRPLMWFDRLDPRDPLQLTDGVYGLLGRYYFLNNANIWIWGLYGNAEKRGWDLLASDKKIPEFGGRVQTPAGRGEIALSYHHRNIGKGSFILPDIGVPLYYEGFSQDRLAIDGKWDLGVGLWFENSIEKNQKSIIPGQKWNNQFNLGTDYTFGFGNGLNLKIEHLVWLSSDDLFKDPEKVNYTAFSSNYPIGLLDQLSLILYYNWENETFYRFVNWGRQYDKLSLFLMAYWNPETFDIYRNTDNVSLFSGKGIQVMIAFNH